MAYNSRNDADVTQFLRELHENPTMLDSDAAFSMDDQDLSMFTNTEFFDLETGQNTDFQPAPQRPSKPASADAAATVPPSALADDAMASMTDFSNINFMATGDFSFPDLAASFASPSLTAFQDTLSGLSQTSLQQALQGIFTASAIGQLPSPAHTSAQSQSQSPSVPISPSVSTPAAANLAPPTPAASQPPHTGASFAVAPAAAAAATLAPTQAHAPPRIAAAEKRKPDGPNPATRALSFEDQARVAAEEDKRRRNTAASARFRIKKKQREQALEKSAKEMTEKVSAMEMRIQQLETENKWLKGIVLEKHAGNEEFLGKLIEEFKSKHGPDAASRLPSSSASAAATTAAADEAPKKAVVVISEEMEAGDASG